MHSLELYKADSQPRLPLPDQSHILFPKLLPKVIAAEGFPLHTYSESGERRDNITDWALKLFQEKYGNVSANQELNHEGTKKRREEEEVGQASGSKPSSDPNNTPPTNSPLRSSVAPQVPVVQNSLASAAITKLDIFHYVYAVLHDHKYRTKYEQNLKRDLPRIPLYPDFDRWRDAGKALMDLHIGFEAAEPWPLKVTDGRKPADAGLFADPADKKARTVIRLDKEKHRVEFETPTGKVLVEGFDPSTWDYKLGHRSGVEWVLDQYADSTPKDPTVAAKFHTYKLAEHLDEVIALLGKVAAVSVATMKVAGEMKK